MDDLSRLGLTNLPLTLLLGGAASGKSALAVRMAKNWGGSVVFVATGEPRDEEMADKIKRHKIARPPDWETVEEPVELSRALTEVHPEAFVIVDCLTLWLSNLLERNYDEQKIQRLAEESASVAGQRKSPTIVVSNEVGSGIVPVNALARMYRNLLGRVNAIWADVAERSLFIVAGKAVPLFDPEYSIRDADG